MIVLLDDEYVILVIMVYFLVVVVGVGGVGVINGFGLMYGVFGCVCVVLLLVW